MRVLWVLSRLVAFGGVAAASFTFGLPGLVVGSIVGIILPWLVRLQRTRRRAARRAAAAATPPTPKRWRPQVRLYGLASGLVAAVGTAIMMQQLSIRLFDRELLVRALIGGIIAGIVVPSVIWWFTVRSYNRRLGQRGPMTRLAAASGTIRVGLVVGGFLLMTLGTIQAAMADQSGPCSLVLNGVSSDSYDYRTDPVEVTEGGTLTIGYFAPAESASGYSAFTYGGFALAAESFSSDDPDVVAESGVIDFAVDDLAWLGSGMYAFEWDMVLADGSLCSGGVSFALPGEPLEGNPIGSAATSMIGMGAVGVVAGAGRDAMDALGELDALGEAPPAPPGSGGAGPMQEELTGQDALDALVESGAQTVVVDGETRVVVGTSGDGVNLEASTAGSAEEVLVDGEVVTVYRPGGGDVTVIRPGGPPTAPAPAGAPPPTGPPLGPEAAPPPGPPAEPTAGAPEIGQPGAEPVSGQPPIAEAPPVQESPPQPPVVPPVDAPPVDAPPVPPAEVPPGPPVEPPPGPAPQPPPVPAAEAPPVEPDQIAPVDPTPVAPAEPSPPAEAPSTGVWGRDLSGWVNDAANALSGAKDRLDGWIDDVFGAEEADQVKETLQTERIGDNLDTVIEATDTYNHFHDMAGETIDDLNRLGVDSNGQNAVTWVRVVTEGAGRLTQTFVDGIVTPVLQPILAPFGGDAEEVVHALLPVQETAEEASRAMHTAARNIRGGDNYAGQLAQNQDLGLDELWRFP